MSIAVTFGFNLGYLHLKKVEVSLLLKRVSVTRVLKKDLRILFFEWEKIFKTKFPKNTTFLIISLNF